MVRLKNRKEYAREVAIDLLRKGKLTKEDIMESFGFSPEEANELAKEVEAVPD